MKRAAFIPPMLLLRRETLPEGRGRTEAGLFFGRNCKAELSEKSLVEPQGGIEVEAMA